MDRKVIVFGATGNTGIKICEQLQMFNIPHAAFVRKGSESKITTNNTELLFGDVLNLEEVQSALKTENFTDVIIALGSRDLQKTLIRSEGTKNVIHALHKLSIKSKVHVLSALGTGNSWSQLNWFGKLICKLFISKAMKDHNLEEEELVNSSLDFHIIRPVGLTNGDFTGKILCKNEGNMPSNQISRADVAFYMVESMVNNKSGFSSICTSNK